MYSDPIAYPDEPEAKYALLNEQLRAITADETHVIPNLANAAALLVGALDQINWAGFYLLRGNTLILGPFQGRPACIRIEVGTGICGQAVAENATQRVGIVHQVEGYIPCDSSTNSEIVVPIHFQDSIVGVLDIDSPIKKRFRVADKTGLEEFAAILGKVCDWNDFRI